MSSERPYYHEFAWAYDLLQTDPVTPRIDFVESVLSNHGIGANSAVLDAGCGTGRYALELARRGYDVCGVDRSPELIAVAKNRALHASVHPEFMIADLLQVTFTRLFDAILSRGILNDFVEESHRIAIFQQFGAWLRPGGIVVFDVREWTRTVARYEKHSVHQRIEGDVDTVASSMSDDYVQTDINGYRQDKTTWLNEYFRPLANLIKAGKFHWDEYERKNLEFRFYGDCAVVTGELQLQGTGAKPGPQHTWVADPNATFSGTLHFTHVYTKQNGKWMLAALHNQIPLPPANAVK